MKFRSYYEDNGGRSTDRTWRAEPRKRGVALYRVYDKGYHYGNVSRTQINNILARKAGIDYLGWTVEYPDRNTFTVGCQRFSMNVARRLKKLAEEKR